MFNIEVKRKSKKTIKAIIVSLNEKSLRFNGDATIKLERVIKEKDASDPNLFSCFNEYVENIFDTDKKIELFKLYEKAYQIAESPTYKDYRVEIAEIKPIINAILNLIDIPKYCSFIQYSEHMVVPPDLSVASSKGDYPEQTTITDYDYKELVKLTFVIRSVYPIIFSLIARFDAAMGTGYSEQVCGSLIKDNAHIVNLYGWKKLQTYVNFAFGKRGIPQQADSIGSVEYFVERVLYDTLFSRLCCAVIPETEEGKHLATAINASVRHHGSIGGGFKAKDAREGEDDKRSLLERYHINEEIKAANETVDAEYFSLGLFDENDNERYVDRFKIPCLGLGIQNPQLVEQVYDNMPPNWDITLDNHVITLLQLTFVDAISPMIFWSCDGHQLRAAIALAQVRLSEQGYHYLPSVLGASNNPGGMRSLSDGLRLNTEDKEFLVSICDIQSRNDEGRSFNEAVEVATEFLETFGNGQWKSNLEYGVLDDPEVYQRVERAALFDLEIDLEIKNEFMRLVRQFNT